MGNILLVGMRIVQGVQQNKASSCSRFIRGNIYFTLIFLHIYFLMFVWVFSYLDCCGVSLLTFCFRVGGDCYHTIYKVWVLKNLKVLFTFEEVVRWQSPPTRAWAISFSLILYISKHLVY